MKKLLIILILMAPVLVMGQRVFTDTINVVSDTIIKFRIYDPNFVDGWYFYADTLDGTGMTMEYVVANDLSENGYPGAPTLVADSLFTLLNPGLRDTLDAPGPSAFKVRYIPFDYGGIRITFNSVTDIFMPYKRITKSQNK